MTTLGRVQNGVVILEDGQSLPEGTIVTVSYPASKPAAPPDSGYRVQFPLVTSGRPGSLDLTADRIAELLEDDDVSLLERFFSAGWPAEKREPDASRCSGQARRPWPGKRGQAPDPRPLPTAVTQAGRVGSQSPFS
jgi:hypothetical protein